MTDKMFKVSPPAQREYRVLGGSKPSGSEAAAKHALQQARQARPAKSIHVVPRPDGWAVKTESRSQASRVLATKAAALKAGREQAQNRGARLIEHGPDGRIQSNTQPRAKARKTTV